MLTLQIKKSLELKRSKSGDSYEEWSICQSVLRSATTIFRPATKPFLRTSPAARNHPLTARNKGGQNPFQPDLVGYFGIFRWVINRNFQNILDIRFQAEFQVQKRKSKGKARRREEGRRRASIDGFYLFSLFSFFRNSSISL